MNNNQNFGRVTSRYSIRRSRQPQPLLSPPPLASPAPLMAPHQTLPSSPPPQPLMSLSVTLPESTSIQSISSLSPTLPPIPQFEQPASPPPQQQQEAELANETIDITSTARNMVSVIEPVVIDIEKDNPSIMIDLTKDCDDLQLNNSDIAVIHEVKNPQQQRNQNRYNRITQFMRRTNNNNNNNNNMVDSTIIIDDDIPSSSTVTSTYEQPAVSHIQSTILPSTSLATTNSTDTSYKPSPNKRQKSIDYNQRYTQKFQRANTRSSNNGETPKEICCPICLETLDEIKSNNKTLMVTFCGHIMCNRCVDEIFKQNKTTTNLRFNNPPSTCPTCRMKITRSKIHSIYL